MGDGNTVTGGESVEAPSLHSSCKTFTNAIGNDIYELAGDKMYRRQGGSDGDMSVGGDRELLHDALWPYAGLVKVTQHLV